MNFDEIADKVEEKIMDKYARNQRAFLPESNSAKKRKEQYRNKPVLTT